MILVDTSVWIGHLRAGRETLAWMLDQGTVLGHPWVAGELALGHLRQRREVLGLLGQLPAAEVATPEEVGALIERHQLYGQGIGYVDAHILTSTRLTAGARLWTDDRRLAAVADQLGCRAVVADAAGDR